MVSLFFLIKMIFKKPDDFTCLFSLTTNEWTVFPWDFSNIEPQHLETDCGLQ